ncbi:MAG: MSMEG_0570 family nitrogen starvation response protein [Pseudomonadota bacterium]
MPELTMRIIWPDGAADSVYSPSTVLARRFTAGETLELAAFVARVGDALQAASARVEQVYGRPCSRALAENARLDAIAADMPAGVVRIETVGA